jgi:hypothetical protein
MADQSQQSQRSFGDLDHLADAGPLARALGALSVALPRRWRQRPLAGLGAGLVVLAVGGVVAQPIVTVSAAVAFVLLASMAVRPPLGGRLAWLMPALLRAAEYALVVRLAAVLDGGVLDGGGLDAGGLDAGGLDGAGLGGRVMPAAYAVLAVVAYHHYDVVYRLRHAGSSAAPWVGVAALGFEGRMLVVLVLWLAGADAAVVGCWVLAGWLAVVFGVESATGWSRWLRAARPDVLT